MKNLPEFKALIERYESITLDEIESEYLIIFDAFTIANKLTGYGEKCTCTLCKPLLGAISEGSITKCQFCVYREGKPYNINYCVELENEKTYYMINNAKTPEYLLKAFKARAKHMRNILKEKGI
jgi:hypothetical protein